MLRRLHQLARDLRGVAAVEFALYSSLFFTVVMGGLDFGEYHIARSEIDKAVGAASVSAFETRDNVDFGGMQAYVRALAEDNALTVTTSCNGVVGACTNSVSRTCSCLKTDGTYVATTCGDPCTATGTTTGSTAGYYLTIRASRPFTPMLLPEGALSGKTIAREATTRLD